MGRALLKTESGLQRVPLSTSALFGRHRACAGILQTSGAPLYWIELRWRGTGWWWRNLGASDRTRGPGTVDAAGWRPICQVRGRGQRIHLSGVGYVELVDDSSPELLLEDLTSGRRIEKQDTRDWLTLDATGCARLTGSPTAPALQDLDVFVSQDRVFRIHIPQAIARTSIDMVDIREATLDIDPSTLRAMFTDGGTEVVVTGVCVLVLLLFAQARAHDHATEGWLGVQEAFERWGDVGGKRDSPPERLAWERGKLRAQLNEAGATGTEFLFETRRIGRWTEVRLAFEPRRIRIWTTAPI